MLLEVIYYVNLCFILISIIHSCNIIFIKLIHSWKPQNSNVTYHPCKVVFCNKGNKFETKANEYTFFFCLYVTFHCNILFSLILISGIEEILLLSGLTQFKNLIQKSGKFHYGINKHFDKCAIFLTTARFTSKSDYYIRVKFDDLAYVIYVISNNPIGIVIYKNKNS